VSLENLSPLRQDIGQQLVNEIVLPEVSGVCGGKRLDAVEHHYTELGLLIVGE